MYPCFWLIPIFLKHNLPSHFHCLHIFRVWKVEFLSHKPPGRLRPEIRTFGSAEKPEDCGVWLPEVTTCRGKLCFLFVFFAEVFMMFNTSHILSGIYTYGYIYTVYIYTDSIYIYILHLDMNMFWHFLCTVLENGMKDGFFKRCGMGIDKALYAGCKIYRIYRCWEHWISEFTSFQHSCIPEQNAVEHTGLRLCDVLCACDADAAWRWNKSMLNPTMTYHAEKCRYTNRCELFVELYLLQVRNLNIYCPSPTEIFWKWHQSSIRALCINAEK